MKRELKLLLIILPLLLFTISSTVYNYHKRCMMQAEFRGWNRGMLNFMRMIETNDFVFIVSNTNEFYKVKAKLEEKVK